MQLNTYYIENKGISLQPMPSKNYYRKKISNSLFFTQSYFIILPFYIYQFKLLKSKLSKLSKIITINPTVVTSGEERIAAPKTIPKANAVERT